MNTFVLAFFGGIIGAVLMDVTESVAARIGISSGVNIGLVGRWFLGLTQGRFAHADILDSPPQECEVRAGWVFHILVGGGGVALLYAAALQFAGPLPAPNLLLCGVLFGLATSVLPWFILLPSFGWGCFGRRGPEGSNALLASPLSHIPYGFGVGAVIAAGSAF